MTKGGGGQRAVGFLGFDLFFLRAVTDSGCSHGGGRCLEAEKYRRGKMLINAVAGSETEKGRIRGRGQDGRKGLCVIL